MTGNIYLIGFMGTGKTTVAKQLAELTGYQALDLDQEIEKRQGMAIREIFQCQGEDIFRKLETEIVTEYAKYADYVIACGGGAVLRGENVRSMKKSGVIILLSASPATIYHRVKQDRSRPLLQGNMSMEGITRIMQTRKDIYLEAADMMIETDTKKPAIIAEEINVKLKKYKKL